MECTATTLPSCSAERRSCVFSLMEIHKTCSLSRCDKTLLMDCPLASESGKMQRGGYLSFILSGRTARSLPSAALQPERFADFENVQLCKMRTWTSERDWMVESTTLIEKPYVVRRRWHCSLAPMLLCVR